VRHEIQRTFLDRSPHAENAVFTAPEDVAVSGIALVNDTDTEVDPRTASLVSGPAHGSPDPGCTRTVTMLVIV